MLVFITKCGEVHSQGVYARLWKYAHSVVSFMFLYECDVFKLNATPYMRGLFY